MQNTTKWYKARRALCTSNALHRPECSACKNHVETSQTDGGGGNAGQQQVRTQHQFTSMIGFDRPSKGSFTLKLS